MKRFVLFAAFVVGIYPGVELIAAQPATAEGDVDVQSVLRMGNTVQRVGDGFRGDSAVDRFVAAAAVPADDNHKWFVSVLCIPNCAPCEQLKKQWAAAANRAETGADALPGDRWLLSLANPADTEKSWSHFNVYDVTQPRAKQKFAGISVKAFPTIVVQPPLSGEFGDPMAVVYQAAYGGDPQKLAEGVSDAMKRYIAKLQPGPANGFGAADEDAEPQAANDADGFGDMPTGVEWTRQPISQPARPQPWGPNDQTPRPASPSSPLPTLPTVPPPVSVPESTPINPTPENGGEELIVVSDGDSEYSLLSDHRVLRAIEEMQPKTGQRLRTRIVDLRDALQRGLPVEKSDLPAVLHVSGNRLKNKLSTTALNVFSGAFGVIFGGLRETLAALWHYMKIALAVAFFAAIGYVLYRVYRFFRPATTVAALGVEAVNEMKDLFRDLRDHLKPTTASATTTQADPPKTA